MKLKQPIDIKYYSNLPVGHESIQNETWQHVCFFLILSSRTSINIALRAQHNDKKLAFCEVMCWRLDFS